MEEDFLSINIEYRFSSFMRSHEAADCIKGCTGILYNGEYSDNIHNEYMGEIYFKIICLDQALELGFDLYEVFDTWEYTFRHGQTIYDFRNETFKKPILRAFPDLEFGCEKLCIIETLGIIPKFRGKNIGAKVFKDLVFNFGHSCGLFIIQPYPLQFEHPENNTRLLPNLNLSKFEKDKKKATASLTKYYQTWGFKRLNGIKELLFFSPSYRNSKFESIDLDDY